MDSTASGVDPLAAGLARASARTNDALHALAKARRVDLSGLPPGASALLLARHIRDAGRPLLVVTPDAESARRAAGDLAFFLGTTTDEDEPHDVLLYPAADTTPFLDVAPDRRAAMDRLAALFHLAHGLPWSALVMPAPALLRRVPPQASLLARSMRVRAEEELDRDAFIRLLAEGGYLRVPVAEDPGTFAVRGGILDVFPPHAHYPARIELDDWLVLSIKLFDPEDQRTVRTIPEVFVHPVRDALLGEAEIALAREKVRALCDSVNLPTTRTRRILDDIESGRAFFGVDAFLPAFYPALESVLDYVPDDTRVVVSDPTAVARSIAEELERAEGDRDAKVAEGAPAFPVDAHYASEAENR